MSVAAPADPSRVARPLRADAAAPADDAAPIALAIAIAGWLGWIFEYLGERDTGRPDGTGCSGVSGQAYRSCMRSAEQSAVVSLSFAAALGTCALTLVAFDLVGRGRSRRRRLVDAAVAAAAGGLAAACAASAWIGARGGWYDGTVGAARWRARLVFGLAEGVALGAWLVFLRRERRRVAGRPQPPAWPPPHPGLAAGPAGHGSRRSSSPGSGSPSRSSPSARC